MRVMIERFTQASSTTTNLLLGCQLHIELRGIILVLQSTGNHEKIYNAELGQIYDF